MGDSGRSVSPPLTRPAMLPQRRTTDPPRGRQGAVQRRRRGAPGRGLKGGVATPTARLRLFIG